jgi:hypothetical protein
MSLDDSWTDMDHARGFEDRDARSEEISAWPMAPLEQAVITDDGDASDVHEWSHLDHDQI